MASDVVGHGVLGEDGHVVTALDETASGGEFGWDRAAAVDEGEEVVAGRAR